jgi:hypothetical protein
VSTKCVCCSASVAIGWPRDRPWAVVRDAAVGCQQKATPTTSRACGPFLYYIIRIVQRRRRVATGILGSSFRESGLARYG